MKKSIIYLLIIIIINSGCLVKAELMGQGAALIGNTNVSFEIARTTAQKVQGLSGRKELLENQGLLFVLEKNKLPVYWMKDMNFPLDFIWIKDNKIVEIDANIPVLDAGGKTTSNITSELSPDYLLEISAGFCDKNNILVGQNFQLK